MKIFFIGAKLSLDNMESHVFEALIDMKHDVHFFDSSSWYKKNKIVDKYIKYAAHKLLREPELKKEKKLIQEVNDFDPDLILVLLGSNLSPKTVKRLKANVKTPIVCWCQDQLSTLGRQYVIGADYDKVFLKDHYMVDLFSSMIGSRFVYLPEACNPKMHFYEKPLVEDAELYQCEITTAATLYYYRQAILEQLSQYDMKVWGALPDWLDYRLNKQHMNKYVKGETKRYAFSSAKIVLNTLHLAEVESMNCRVFEAAGCGAFQIVSYKDSISEFFTIGKEIETFKDIAELKDKVDYYLSHDAERNEIAMNAMKRAHDSHTYQQRLNTMLNLI